jgi:hypothetical protein
LFLPLSVYNPARASPKIGENLIFWHKIVIFHTKYPKNFRASLRNWKKYNFLADPGFQVRGGGGALKKIALSGGRREHFWGISCEKLRFYAKKLYFYNCGGRREKFWGILCEKSRHEFIIK